MAQGCPAVFVDAMKIPCALRLACFSLIITHAALAEESVRISSILKTPDDYHLQVVTVEGRVQEMQPVQQVRSMLNGTRVCLRPFPARGSERINFGPASRSLWHPGLAAPFIPGFTNEDRVFIEARKSPG